MCQYTHGCQVEGPGIRVYREKMTTMDHVPFSQRTSSQAGLATLRHGPVRLAYLCHASTEVIEDQGGEDERAAA